MIEMPFWIVSLPEFTCAYRCVFLCVCVCEAVIAQILTEQQQRLSRLTISKLKCVFVCVRQVGRD